MISRADLDSHGLTLGDAAYRQTILDLVPIRLGCRCTNTHWRATPADGFCGLYALLRLKKLLPPTLKQKPDLPALIDLIQADLIPLCSKEASPDALDSSSATRAYLTRTLLLLQSGRRLADTEDCMPMESMQFLLERYSATTAF